MPDRETIIQALQDLHEEHGYLPADEVKRAAERLRVPLSQVFSVATFYRAFSLVPRGKRVVRVCLGTACHVRGGKAVLTEMESKLGIKDETEALNRLNRLRVE